MRTDSRHSSCARCSHFSEFSKLLTGGTAEPIAGEETREQGGTLCNLGPSTYKEIELQPAHPAFSRSKALSPVLYRGKPIEHSLSLPLHPSSPPLSSSPLLAIEIGERKNKEEEHSRMRCNLKQESVLTVPIRWELLGAQALWHSSTLNLKQ